VVIAVAAPTVEQVRAWLDEVPDPEIPVISIVDLGIVRDVAVDARSGACTVTITPTYSGCPAMGAIAEDVERALRAGTRREAPCDPGAGRRLPALRLDAYAADQPVRLDPVQGAVRVPRLPRALRLLQMPLRTP
jgi:hypothetical protein